MEEIKIQIIEEIHYIEGNRYSAFFIFDDKNCPIAIQRTEEREIIRICNAIRMLAEKMKVKMQIDRKTWKDPNFESYEEAMKYLQTKDK